jgi:hypothetical protein
MDQNSELSIRIDEENETCSITKVSPLRGNVYEEFPDIVLHHLLDPSFKIVHVSHISPYLSSGRIYSSYGKISRNELFEIRWDEHPGFHYSSIDNLIGRFIQENRRHCTLFGLLLKKQDKCRTLLTSTKRQRRK